MFSKKKPRAPKAPETNRHFIFVEVPVSIVGPEVMLWGAASWWPKRCGMRFVKKTDGDVRLGTVYRQKAGPLMPAWTVEVTKIVQDHLVEHVFKTGLFKGGHEVILAEERSNGTRVEYELQYTIHDPFNKILWNLFYRKTYDKNVECVLGALKDFVVKKYQQEQERQSEQP